MVTGLDALMIMDSRERRDKLITLFGDGSYDRYKGVFLTYGPGLDFSRGFLAPLATMKVLSGKRVLFVCPSIIKESFKKDVGIIPANPKNMSNKHISIMSYQKFYNDCDDMKGKFDFAIFHDHYIKRGKIPRKISEFVRQEKNCNFLITGVELNGTILNGPDV
jgi:hypothetical protein